uniref:Helix-turn-helix domain-containing protein n=1 Tax=OCS116 cluster bacterium TaxID=2030921 RepID=A0A2A4YUN1_9PROT
MTEIKFISKKNVCVITSLSNTTLWRMEHRGEFPKRHKIGLNRVAWLQSDIENWIASKVGVTQ